MYWIIGHDGREYRAASWEELQCWLAAGRVTPETLVRTATDAQWRPLSELLPPPNVSPSAAPPARTNGMAVAGLILGVISIAGGLCCGGPVFAGLGIVFSAIGLNQIRQGADQQSGRSLALTGLWVSIGGLALNLGAILFWAGFGLLGGLD